MTDLKFKSASDMKSTLDKKDLYNPNTETYVFLYNEAGSIAVYEDISLDEALQLEKDAKAINEYWAAFLGPGGEIYDDVSHPLYNKDLLSNTDWCEQHYTEEGWILTTDVTEYAKNKKG